MARKPALYGVIVIGAQNISLQIVDRKASEVIENVHYDIDLGEDVFSERAIHSQTVNEISEALVVVQNLMKDYDVADYRCYATHSFHEAENAEFVREQLHERTGMDITWVSQSQESLYRSLATHVFIKDFKEIIQNNALLLDVSSGNVELTMYANGKYIFSRNLKLGPLRVYEVMRDVKISVPNYVEVLRDYVSSELVDFIRLLPQAGAIRNVILMGSSMTLFEPMIQDGQYATKMPIEEFDALYTEITHGNDQLLTEKFEVQADDVPQVLPIMILMKELLGYFQAQTLWMTPLKLIDGIVVNTLQSKQPDGNTLEQEAQIRISAYNLAKRYHVEEKHQQFVVNYSLQLFDRLKKIHGMGQNERLLLELAAILDDVGSFVSNHNHYAHSDYIIQNSELIGLSDVSLKMVAAIARYHSSDTPSSELQRFKDLPMKHRMIIAKLTAILRLADALDASRQQKIKSIRVSLKEPTKVLIRATANDDIELERWTFAKKGAFFESVFGVEPILKGRVKL